MSKKTDVLKFATWLFASKGFSDTSMTEVAEMSGIASATIFYHFKTKEDLFLACLGAVKDGIIEEFSRYFDGKAFENGLAQLKESVAFYLYLAGSREEWFLLLHRHHPYKLAQQSETCRTYLVDIYDCFVNILKNH